MTEQLLADAAPNTVYDPDTNHVVQAELAADAAAAADPEATGDLAAFLARARSEQS